MTNIAVSEDHIHATAPVITRSRGACLFLPFAVRGARGMFCCLLAVSAISSVALAAAQLTRNGFTAGAARIEPGKHIATGWSVGFPIGGERQVIARGARLTDSYWAGIFMAGPPPAPGLMTPILILPGTTGSYDNADAPLLITGTKPPNSVNYPFYGLIYATTNDVRLPDEQITQVQDYNQWSMTLPLALDAQVALTLVSSNMFGLSSAPTVVYLTQVPEPYGAAALVIILLSRVSARTRRHA